MQVFVIRQVKSMFLLFKYQTLIRSASAICPFNETLAFGTAMRVAASTATAQE